MKKILMVANLGYTLSNFRKELMETLRQKGHEVILLCPKARDLDEGLDQLSYPVYDLPMTRGEVAPIKDLKTICSMVRVIREVQPDVVLNFTIKPVIYMSVVAKLFSKARIFSNITGLGYVFTDTKFRTRILRWFIYIQYKIALMMNERVFFQNPDDAKLFTDLGLVDQDKISLLNGSGINLGRFRPDATVPKIPQSFLFVGRLLKDKGIHELLAATMKVKEKFPDIQVTVIGSLDDNPNSLSKTELDVLVKNKVVTYLGRIEDVRPHLLRHQVLVLPSYREGTPRSVLEAMASGLAIITTDTPGCRETVVHEKNGYLVKVGDVDSLAKAIEKLAENQELSLNMGAKSLEYARQKYDVHQVNQAIINTLKLGH